MPNDLQAAKEILAEIPEAHGLVFCGVPVEQFSKDEIIKMLGESMRNQKWHPSLYSRVK